MTKKELGTYLFIFAFGISLFRISLANTTFSEYINTSGTFFVVCLIISIFLVSIKVVFCDQFYIFDMFLYALLLLTSLLIYVYSGYFDILYLCILLLGAKEVDLEKIVKTHFYIYSGVMSLAFICSILGIIENYTVYSSFHGVRYSFGNTYPTDFAAGILYLLIDFAFLKKKKWSFKNTFFSVIIVIFVFFFTRAVMNFGLSICVILIMQIYGLNNVFNLKVKLLLKKIISGIGMIIYPLLCLGSVIMVNMFSNGSSILNIINTFSDNRLSYSYLAIKKYGFTLFGNNVDLLGNGWNTVKTVFNSNYFYVDNGFIYVLICYGMIILLSICFLNSLVSFEIRGKETLLTIILIIIAIDSIGEPRFINYLYNPFLFSISCYALFKRVPLNLSN